MAIGQCLGALEEELQWPVEEVKTEDALLSVSCDPRVRQHYFFLPREGKKLSDVQRIRCLAHAWLAEKVHPLFSVVVAECPDGFPEKAFSETLWPVLSISRVWFADAVVVDHCPESASADVKARLNILEEIFPSGKLQGALSDCLEAALILAEGNIFCGIERQVRGKLADMADVFTGTDPFSPSLDVLKDLNNRLLGLWSPFRVDVAENAEMGMDTWQVF
ncbi:MAG: hypothetical protein ACLFN0_03475 [Thermovirgaceae bacterium]